MKEIKSTPKQIAWRKRVQLLWILKGMHIPEGIAPTTLDERNKISEANAIIKDIVNNFTANSISLGFKAVNRCYYCSKPAISIDKNGHYLCEDHKEM